MKYEFYDLLGLIPTDYGDYVGWSANELFETHWEGWVEFDHNKVIMNDGLEDAVRDFVTVFNSAKADNNDADKFKSGNEEIKKLIREVLENA